MQIDLLSDLAEMRKEDLEEMGYQSGADEDPETVLRRYYTVQQRIPPEIEWTIEQSDELQKSKDDLTQKQRDGLKKLNKAARNGESLKPHLSRKIARDPDFVDDLQVERNIFHFHLDTEETEIEGHEMVKGHKEILFAFLCPEEATMYQLEVAGHEWARQERLDIIEDNWPEILDEHELGGVEVQGGPSDEKVRKWRDLNVNTTIETEEGRGVGPMGGGMTTAGTSMDSERLLRGDMRTLDKVEEKIRNAREELSEDFQDEYGLEWEDLEFELAEYGEEIRVRETNTGELVYRRVTAD